MLEVFGVLLAVFSAVAASSVAVGHKRRGRWQKQVFAAFESLGFEPGKAPLVAGGIFERRPVTVELIHRGLGKTYGFRLQIRCIIDQWFDLQFHVLHKGLQRQWGDFEDDFDVVNEQAQQIRTGCELTAKIAEQIETAGSAVPVAPQLADYVASWTEFARGHGLQSSAVPFGFEGRFNGVRVCAWVVPAAFYVENRGDYWLEVAAMFPEGLGLDFTVSSRLVGKLPPVKMDAQTVDDSAFDRLFRIDGPEPDARKEQLSPELRRELAALCQDVQAVTLADQRLGVRLDVVPRSPQKAFAVMKRLADSAQTIAELCSRGTDKRSGPYR
jgi:hypothetical protein